MPQRAACVGFDGCQEVAAGPAVRALARPVARDAGPSANCSATKPSRMTGCTGWPNPGSRWIAPSASCRPRAVSKSTEFTHPWCVMVATHDGHELGWVSRDRPGVEHGVRPVGVAAVVLRLPAAVRVHVKQDARDEVRQIRVLPAQ